MIKKGQIEHIMKDLRYAETDEKQFHLCYNGCTDANDVNEELGMFDISFIK